MDATTYREQLQALLPPGSAWPRTPDATLSKLLDAAAAELARVDARAAVLLEEADPLTTLELLPDWERAVGLPDECMPIAVTVKERQLAIARKITGLGGQSVPFFLELTARAGVEAEIVEFVPFDANSRVDAELNDDDWRFAFAVRALPASETTNATTTIQVADLTTAGRVDERLRSFGSESLECVISRAKPAHTEVLFAYPEDPEPMLWFNFLAA